MASRVNSDFAYINLINGETVWERLRIVRNFLEDRKIAKKLQKTQEKKRTVLEAELEEAKATGLRSAILNVEIKLEEFDARQEQLTDGYAKLDEELKFLERYEKELTILAEQTRVLGKTDDEMYQINTRDEVIARNLRKIETERVANVLGCSPATADEAMKVPGLRQQMMNTAQAMTFQIPADIIPEEKIKLLSLRQQLIENGLDFSKTMLTVQEELELNQKLLPQ